MINYIWIIEMWIDDKKQWETTMGIGLTKEDALQELKKWKNRNPNDKFRIKKYITI